MFDEEAVRIYTDGGCRNEVGGWAWWVEGTDRERSGSEYPSTNQRMELWAALNAIRANYDVPEIKIVSDSAYLVNCFWDRWYDNWFKNDWRSPRGNPIANRDIWEPLVDLVLLHRGISFEKVKGHTGEKGNTYVDRMASAAIAVATHSLVKEQ